MVATALLTDHVGMSGRCELLVWLMICALVVGAYIVGVTAS